MERTMHLNPKSNCNSLSASVLVTKEILFEPSIESDASNARARVRRVLRARPQLVPKPAAGWRNGSPSPP
jgi:hypothetical protein